MLITKVLAIKLIKFVIKVIIFRFIENKVTCETLINWKQKLTNEVDNTHPKPNRVIEKECKKWSSPAALKLFSLSRSQIPLTKRQDEKKNQLPAAL